MNRRLLTTLALLVSLMPAAARTDTILNFDDLSLPDYGLIAADYGSHASGAPNVGVSYRTFIDATGTMDSNQLQFWNTNYGDLSKVAYANGNGFGAEIALTPDAGYSVTLASFNLAGYPRTNLVASFVRIVDTQDNILWSLPDNSTIIGAGPSHSTFTPNLTSTTTLRIQWGINWNIGIDNISYSQAEAGIVPEPTSLAMGSLAAAMLFVASRSVRRRDV